MWERIRFLIEYLKNPKLIGAVAPSSKFLVKSIVKEVDPEEASYVVEFGAGQGHITRALLKKLHKNQKLFAFEVNKKFIEGLKKIEDERLTVIEEDAENIQKELERRNIPKADYIVSALPLTMWQKEKTAAILKASSDVLTNKGKFIQYAFYLRNYSQFKQYFARIKLKYTLLNIPPNFVYVCSK